MKRVFTIDFTRSFMEGLADYLERQYIRPGRSMDKLAVIFGGKRPPHFLKRLLFSRFGDKLVLPRFFNVNDFMDEIASVTGKRVSAASIDDAYEIYSLAKELAPELLKGRASFAQFLPWSVDILNFIGQLDIEAVEPLGLKAVQESARIGFPVPESINSLLDKIGLLRQAFHERLALRNSTSRGLQYLRAKENVAAWVKGPGKAFDEIIFANFFYFHQTEAAVARVLDEAEVATFIFQGDERKWPVLERLARMLDVEIKEGRAVVPTSFDLKVHTVADRHAEAAVVRDILALSKDLSNTLVVVPDASSLVPFLASLGDDIKDINVSLGHPLKRSSLYLLIQTIFKMHVSRRGSEYYSKDYLAFLTNPLVARLLLGGQAGIMPALAKVIADMIKGRLTSNITGETYLKLEAIESFEVFDKVQSVLVKDGVNLEVSDIANVLKQVHDLAARRWCESKSLLEFGKCLKHFLDVMASQEAVLAYPLNAHVISRLREWADSIEKALFAHEPFCLEDIRLVFEDSMENEVVHFKGTPLKGLQVLGLEETRSLNFDHVIVMDVNEGVLPKVNASPTLIPREVMIQLRLDRLELEEEIQRYQFMRVISSAKQVHLVYQQNKEKEPSRFLEELVWEAQQKSGTLFPYPVRRAAFMATVTPQVLSASKTPAMIEFLKNFTFSASSINAYVANPYTFYTTYVLGLREEDDLLDEPDAAFIGNFFHEFLEGAYKPLEGKPLDISEDFEKHLWSMFERRFEEVLVKKMRSDAFLVKKVMEHKIRAFLANEKERSTYIKRLLGFEKDFSSVIKLPSGNMKLKARIDRLEETASGALMVLDYKTGSVDRLPQKPVHLSEKLDRREIFNKIRSFQLPIYMHMACESLGSLHVNAGLYSLRDAEINAIFNDKFPLQEASVYLQPFYAALDYLLQEILDPQKPFVDDELKKLDF